jgi:hypothetical protein
MSDLVPYSGPSQPQPQPRIIVRPSQDPNWERREAVREHVRHLAWLMDGAFHIPGTNVRIGIDPLLGLIPVLGDLIGFLIGGYIIFLAAGLGVPRVVLARMWLNVAIDTVIGSIPVVGDLLDVAWKANLMNTDLLDRALDDPRGTARRSAWYLAGLTALLVGLTAAVVYLLVWIIGLLLRAVS